MFTISSPYVRSKEFQSCLCMFGLWHLINFYIIALNCSKVVKIMEFILDILVFSFSKNIYLDTNQHV